MCDDDGNNNRIGHNSCRSRDNSFNYDIIDGSMQLWYKDERVSSGEYSNSTVRKQHVQGGSKAFKKSKTKDVHVNDVDNVEEDKGKNINWIKRHK